MSVHRHHNIRHLKAVLLGNGSRAGVLEGIAKLRPELEQLVTIVDSDYTGREDMSSVNADFAIVFGGDGSILRAVHQLGRNQIPVLAVNLGSLGFLSSMNPDELIPFLKTPDFSHFSIREQVLLECSLIRKANGHKPEQCLARRLVVNEVALLGGPPFNILHIELKVDGDAVTTYRGDGLIISTPVGSTAHSLSAGGPILRKDLNAVIILPINPHTLNNRPVIDSANRIYELAVLDRDVHLVIDGDSSLVTTPEDRVVIQKAPVTFKMIRIPGRSYYRTLREKLGWNH